MELKDLGLSKDEIFEAVVNKISGDLLAEKYVGFDEDGCEYDSQKPTPFSKEIRKAIQDKIEKTVTDIADKYILPNAETMIKNLVLQKTNQWGEAKGKSMSFIEYLTDRAESYMQEPVDYSGKTKAESGSYSWNKNTTRVSFVIDKYLQYTIENWAKEALKNANRSIVEGLSEAVKIQLDEINKRLKIKIDT